MGVISGQCGGAVFPFLHGDWVCLPPPRPRMRAQYCTRLGDLTRVVRMLPLTGTTSAEHMAADLRASEVELTYEDAQSIEHLLVSSTPWF